MKIKKLIVDGFRSFGTRTVIEFSKENAFIGNNGSGKTSCLLAMNKMFSPNASERSITRNDFYMCSENKSVSSRKLMIEAIFQLDNALNGKDQDAEREYWRRLLVESNNSCPILRVRLNAEWTDDGSVEGSVDTKYSFILSPENTTREAENSQLARRSELSSIRFIYIPATRNPEKQLGNASGALITHLIKKMKWSDEIRDKLMELGKNTNDVFWEEAGVKILQNSIREEWRNLTPDSRYSCVQTNLSSTNLGDLINQVQFNFQSSITNNKYSIKEMSDGIKSLFYISNIASLLDVEQKINKEEINDIRKPILTMLALEEPENHISPHLLGNLMSKLKEISNLVNTQVFITSHSPSIIKRINPKQIRYVRLTNSGTKIRELELPSEKSDAYKFIKNGILLYPELYFSKLVIIGEGDSEEVVLTRIFNNYSGLDKEEISVVPLGGRYIDYIWKLLNCLNIPCITLLDLDMERYQGGTERIKYILKSLEEFKGKNQSIVQLENELDNVNGDRSKLLEVAKKLEEFDVFLSNPLDLDFMMLQSFPEEYKSNLSRGPQKNTSMERILNSVLKGKRTSGDMYTSNEKELMRYYNTLFLNIGKPITHIEALDKIDDEKLREQLPETLKCLVECAKNKVVNDQMGGLS